MIYFSILLAIVVATILNTSFVASKVDKTVILKKTIQEIKIITRAVDEYHLQNNIFPDEKNNCISAFTILTSSPTFLVNIDEVNPLFNNYITNCNNTHFNIEIKTRDGFDAKYIKNQIDLPAIIKTTPDTDTAVVTIPKPLSSSLYDKFLALGDTTATATIYEGKGNSIQNIRDITLSDGKVLSNAFETRYTIDPTITTKIIKPVCNSGTPEISGSSTALYASNSKALFGFRIYEEVANSTATEFAIQVDVLTEDGFVAPASGSAINVTTYCI